MRHDFIRSNAGSDWGSFLWGLLFFACGIVVVMLGYAVRYVALMVNQARRNAIAQEIVHSIGTSSTPFALYLRPFALTARLAQREQYLFYPGVFTFGPDQLSDEEIWIADLLDPIGLLLAIEPIIDEPKHARAEPGAGAARVFSANNEWKLLFERLALRAKIVIMIPSAHGGVLWEFRRLTELGLLGKAIFYMPRAATAVDSKGTIVSAMWNDAATAFRVLGFEIPSYDSSGKFFKLSPNGSMSESQSIGSSPIEELRACIESWRGAELANLT